MQAAESVAPDQPNPATRNPARNCEGPAIAPWWGSQSYLAALARWPPIDSLQPGAEGAQRFSLLVEPPLVGAHRPAVGTAGEGRQQAGPAQAAALAGGASFPPFELGGKGAGHGVVVVVVDERRRASAMRRRLASRQASVLRQQREQRGAVRRERTSRGHWVQGWGASGSGRPAMRARQRAVRCREESAMPSSVTHGCTVTPWA